MSCTDNYQLSIEIIIFLKSNTMIIFIFFIFFFIFLEKTLMKTMIKILIYIIMI